jgi:hypothetical protein
MVIFYDLLEQPIYDREDVINSNARRKTNNKYSNRKYKQNKVDNNGTTTTTNNNNNKANQLKHRFGNNEVHTRSKPDETYQSPYIIYDYSELNAAAEGDILL